ncbi:MAG: MBL fold metallo-hydrolase [Gemmatimonadota bacterium]
MIELHVLGSGSAGNAFALASEDAVLLVDAGFSAKELERRAALSGLHLDRLVGIALTHEHGDHTTGAVRLAKKRNVPIVATRGTFGSLDRSEAPPAHLPLATSSLTEVGPFSIGCCPVLHDAREPVALQVEADGVRLGFAYDLGRPTMALRYLFRSLDAVVIESNYDEVMLRTSEYPASVQHRIAGSSGHLSNTSTGQLLLELLPGGIHTVVLAHLSLQCNSPTVARETVAAILARRGFRGRVEVALQHEPLAPIQLRSARAAQYSLDLSLFTTGYQDRGGPSLRPDGESRDRSA